MMPIVDIVTETFRDIFKSDCYWRAINQREELYIPRDKFLNYLFTRAEEMSYRGPTQDLFNTAERIIAEGNDFEGNVVHPLKRIQGIYE